MTRGWHDLWPRQDNLLCHFMIRVSCPQNTDYPCPPVISTWYNGAQLDKWHYQMYKMAWHLWVRRSTIQAAMLDQSTGPYIIARSQFLPASYHPFPCQLQLREGKICSGAWNMIFNTSLSCRQSHINWHLLAPVLWVPFHKPRSWTILPPPVCRGLPGAKGSSATAWNQWEITA